MSRHGSLKSLNKMMRYLFAYLARCDIDKLKPGMELAVVLQHAEVSVLSGKALDDKLRGLTLKAYDIDDHARIIFGEYVGARVARNEIYANYRITRIQNNSRGKQH